MSRFCEFKISIRKYWVLYALFIPCAVMLIIFNYVPMYGIVLAFKDFSRKTGILGSPWAVPIFKYFEKLFKDPYFIKVTFNTIVISVLRLVVGFPAPIILALLFNELKVPKFKKSVQTILYMPHFLSWVILGGILKTILSSEGLVNVFFTNIGLNSTPFLTNNSWFVFTLITTEIWKSVGFASIIYLAALAGIDAELYEAAKIDGANRFHLMWYITLPCIVGAISINLILSLSGILNAGFDQIFNLYSPVVYNSADVIDTYVYRIGIQDGNYSLATALGLFKSAVGFVLIVVTNKVIRKAGGEGIW